MREALALAAQAIGLSDPNPRVGCVLVDARGEVVGRGHTQQAGGPHAEVMALRDAAALGAAVRGGGAWITLEPCAHHGRTPPCCDALIAAGIARAVVAVEDPYPEVAGRGIAKLRAAGVAVEVLPTGELADAARELNVGFFSRHTRGRPWLRLKAAVSLDGRTALASGASRWITGEAARRDGHAWRKRAGAVLTGTGTVIDDDPRLDVREVPTGRQPLRVVVDTRLRTPPAARLLAPPGAALIYGGDAALEGSAAAAALRQRGAELCFAAARDGAVELAAVLADLAARGVNEVHVEAGERLNGAFVRAGLVDEYLIYVAPLLLGAGRGVAAIGPFAALAEGERLRFVEVERVGDDLRIRARDSTRIGFVPF